MARRQRRRQHEGSRRDQPTGQRQRDNLSAQVEPELESDQPQDGRRHRFDSSQTIVAALRRKLRIRQQPDSITPAAPRRKWRRLLLFSAVGLLVLTMLAPRILVRPSVLNGILRSTLPELRGEITVGRASAGWLSSVSLGDVTIKDENAQPLLFLQELTTTRSLLHLVSRPSKVGLIEVVQPHLHLRLRPDGSNLEDVIASLVTAREPTAEVNDEPSQAPLDIELILTEGSIVFDTGTQQWSADRLNGRVNTAKDITLPISAELSGHLSAGAERGTFTVAMAWTPPSSADQTAVGHGTAKLSATSIPLELAELIAHRTGQQITTEGSLQTDLCLSWEGRSSGSEVSLDGSLLFTNLRLHCATLLGADVLRVERMESSVNLGVQGELVTLNNLTLNSDFCSVLATGAAHLHREWLAGSFHLPPPPRDAGYRIKGDVDLAALSQMLPNTLSLRSDTQLTSGNLSFDIASQPSPKGSSWQGSFTSDGLSGVHQQRTVSWDQPVDLSFEVTRHDAGQLLLDQLRCESQFLRISASQTAEQARIRAAGDLGGLMGELEKFIDLGGVSLAGQLHIDGSWQQQQTGEVDAAGLLVLREFALATPTGLPWHEPQLSLNVHAQGRITPSNQIHLNQGSFNISAGDDQFAAALRESILVDAAAWQVPLRFELAGQVENWLARVAPWCNLSDWRASGTIESQGNLDLVRDSAKLSQSSIEIEQLMLRGPGIQISEPKVLIQTSLTWNHASQEVNTNNTTVASSALAFRADQLRLSLEGSGEGHIGFRADVDRLSRWFEGEQLPGYRSTGSVLGRITLTQQEDKTSFSGTLDMEPFDLYSHVPPAALAAGGQRWQPLWHENHVSMEGSGFYRSEIDVLMVDQLSIVSDGVRVTTSGELSQLLGNLLADITGQAEYDLAVLNEKLRPLLGDGVRVVGQHAESFTVRGPLTAVIPGTDPTASASSEMKLASARAGQGSNAVLAVESGFGWESANLYGMSIGPNQFRVRLSEGVLRSTRWDLQVGDGRLSLAPAVYLQGQPTLVLDQHTTMDRLRLTPELCGAWLKYVAPLLADSAEVDGTFSVALNGASFPLQRPQNGSAAGVLLVHSAQLTPGPLAKQFLAIAQQVSSLVDRQRRWNGEAAWIEVSEREIEFQMQDGRVHHRGLEVSIDDVIVRTQGWVSADQTLSLLAEVPIQDKWIERERMLAGLRGQSIEIPIHGTLSRPNLDERALRQISRKLLGSAAQGILQNEVQNQLKKLFGS